MNIVYRGVWWNGKVLSNYEHFLDRPYIWSRPIVSLYMGMEKGIGKIDANLLLYPDVEKANKVLWMDRKPPASYSRIQRHFLNKGHNFLLNYENGILKAKQRSTMPTECSVSAMTSAKCSILQKTKLHVGMPDNWPFPRHYFGPFWVDDEYAFFYQSVPPEYTNSKIWETSIVLHNMKTNKVAEMIMIKPRESGMQTYYSDGITYKEEFILLMNKLSNPVLDHIIHGFTMIDPIFRMYYDLWNGKAYQFTKTGEENGVDVGKFEKMFDFKGLREFVQFF